MKTLLLVRHGETDWNITHRFQGTTDVSLNAAGLQQAGHLAKRFENQHFDIIYSSDLSRALETAKRITKQPIRADARLREIHFGLWEGLHMPEIEEQYPVELAAWRKHNIAPPKGEDVFQVAARANSILIEALEALEANQRALFVAHGGLIGVLVCLLLEQPPTKLWSYRFSNTSITEFGIFSWGNVLLRLNDTRHLPED